MDTIREAARRQLGLEGRRLLVPRLTAANWQALAAKLPEESALRTFIENSVDQADATPGRNVNIVIPDDKAAAFRVAYRLAFGREYVQQHP